MTQGGEYTVTEVTCKYCGHSFVSAHPSSCTELECSKCHIYLPVTPIESDAPVKAVEFDRVELDRYLTAEGMERLIYVTVDLSDGRMLGIDDAGIYDRRDVDPDTRIARQNFNYVSWGELLEVLDRLRCEAMN